MEGPRLLAHQRRDPPRQPHHAPGGFLFSGGVTLLIHPDGRPQVLRQREVENLCETPA
ncbi:hypothetical protein ACIRVF_28090 [Kitasatospora sp. NPDC101157]|uniref:hypothetical protein n=1 Tax=Kitasatospora sp. NPDC101157 TaxID=3364098 RepID=UPI00380B1D85